MALEVMITAEIEASIFRAVRLLGIPQEDCFKNHIWAVQVIRFAMRGPNELIPLTDIYYRIIKEVGMIPITSLLPILIEGRKFYPHPQECQWVPVKEGDVLKVCLAEEITTEQTQERSEGGIILLSW